MTDTLKYAFEHGGQDVAVQLDCLERYLDPITAQRLAGPVVHPGDHCWEVGAGGGSVARMLARAAGSDGMVVATDLDTSHLSRLRGVVVRTQDLRTDPVPAGGPFQLIHARLVLLHLPERRAILRNLAGALAPGGWLVVEEFDCTATPRVLRSPYPAAEKLFTQVLDGVLDALRQRGADLAWAQEVYGEMAAVGLTDIDALVHAQSWAGGSPGARLYEVNCRQLQPKLVDAGYDMASLRRFQSLMWDPHFAAFSYQFVSTRGRRPLD
ncbi:MAG TPA: methyltransferase domain-containing protein [Rugosimonospora sp.]|nr:methyltransferase domain-containing protein [Rugosimonospora sp.]